MSMFCYQCEETSKGTGCALVGICGKEPANAALQDILIYATKGVSMYAHRAGQLGARDAEVDRFVVKALFTTVTNVDFDPERLAGWVKQAAVIRDRAKAVYEKACQAAGKTPETLAGPAAWQPAAARHPRAIIATNQALMASLHRWACAEHPCPATPDRPSTRLSRAR